MDQNKSLGKSKYSPIEEKEVSDITVHILEGIRPSKNNKKNATTSKAVGCDGNNSLEKDNIILAPEEVSEIDVHDKKLPFVADSIKNHGDVFTEKKTINSIEESSNNAQTLEDETLEVDFDILKTNKHKKTLSKANISEPQNFQHLYSISKTSIWSDNNERDKNDLIHNVEKEFLGLSGVTEIDLRNRKAQSCIASISNDHEDVLIVKKNINSLKNSNTTKVSEDEAREDYFGTNKSKSKKRLSKADIGVPHNFQHLYSISKSPMSNENNELDDGGLIHNIDKDCRIRSEVMETSLRDKKSWSCIAGFSDDHDDTFAVKNIIENFLNNAKVPVDEILQVGYDTIKTNQHKKKLTSDKIGVPYNFRHVGGFSKTSVRTSNNELHKDELTPNIDKDSSALVGVSETDLDESMERRSCIADSSNYSFKVIAENKQTSSQIQDNRMADNRILKKSEHNKIPSEAEHGEPHKFQHVAEISETNWSHFAVSNEYDELHAENNKINSQIQDNREADIETLKKNELKIRLSAAQIDDLIKAQGWSENNGLENDGLKNNGDLAPAEGPESDQKDEKTRPCTKERRDVLVVKNDNKATENPKVAVDETRENGFNSLKKNHLKKKITILEIGKPYNFRHVGGFSKMQTENIGKGWNGPKHDEVEEILNMAEESFITDNGDITTVKKDINANENTRLNENVPIRASIEDTTKKNNEDWSNLKVMKDIISKPSNFKHVNAARFPP